MKIAITGAAGLVGRKLVERLVRDGALNGRDITDLLLIDVIEPAAPAGVSFAVETQAADISAPGAYDRLAALRPDVIFHLAAIVSGEAETDFEKGYRINLDGTRGLYEAVRLAGFNPRLVFTSSIAVFGAPFPEAIGDEFLNAPLTSYGAQKAMGELMLADYTRKGMLDGIGIRLPTIVVRPGKPNKAASGFFSGILREPLMGHRAVCPVSKDVMHWMASPRSAVNFLIHAAGPRRRHGGPAPQPDHARHRGHGRRDGRVARARRRRRPGQADRLAARSVHRQDRRRLAAQVRRLARHRTGLQVGDRHGPDHPRVHRRRARQPQSLNRARAAVHGVVFEKKPEPARTGYFPVNLALAAAKSSDIQATICWSLSKALIPQSSPWAAASIWRLTMRVAMAG